METTGTNCSPCLRERGWWERRPPLMKGKHVLTLFPAVYSTPTHSLPACSHVLVPSFVPRPFLQGGGGDSLPYTVHTCMDRLLVNSNLVLSISLLSSAGVLIPRPHSRRPLTSKKPYKSLRGHRYLAWVCIPIPYHLQQTIETNGVLKISSSSTRTYMYVYKNACIVIQ